EPHDGGARAAVASGAGAARAPLDHRCPRRRHLHATARRPAVGALGTPAAPLVPGRPSRAARPPRGARGDPPPARGGGPAPAGGQAARRAAANPAQRTRPRAGARRRPFGRARPLTARWRRRRGPGNSARMSDAPFVVQKVEWFQLRDPAGKAFFVMVASLPNGYFTAVPCDIPLARLEHSKMGLADSVEGAL